MARPRARDSSVEAAGIKFTTTRTDLRNAYLARKLARRLRGGRSFYDWIRVGAIPELVEQVDKFRSLGEPPFSHRHHSTCYYLFFVVDKRIPEYRVGRPTEPSSSRVAAKFGSANVTWTGPVLNPSQRNPGL